MPPHSVKLLIMVEDAAIASLVLGPEMSAGVKLCSLDTTGAKRLWKLTGIAFNLRG
jgi:hypothetical protein